jgi:hypothetical protein
MFGPVLLGAMLGGLFAVAARGRRGRDESRVQAIGLVAAALVYVGFALADGTARWVAIEAIGLAVFGTVAWLGLRRSPRWLVAGWVAHVAWDVGLHLERWQPVVGDWYPLLCVGFDLVVAGFLLRSLSSRDID